MNISNEKDSAVIDAKSYVDEHGEMQSTISLMGPADRCCQMAGIIVRSIARASGQDLRDVCFAVMRAALAEPSSSEMYDLTKLKGCPQGGADG